MYACHMPGTELVAGITVSKAEGVSDLVFTVKARPGRGIRNNQSVVGANREEHRTRAEVMFDQRLKDKEALVR